MQARDTPSPPMTGLPRPRTASPTTVTLPNPLRRVRVTSTAVGAAKFLDEIPGFNEEMNRAPTRPKVPAKQQQHVLLRRPPQEREKDPALEWVPLVEDVQLNAAKEPTHEELRDMDRRRKKLLTLARDTSAIDTLLKLRQLGRTVLPRLAMKPLIYVFLVIFATGASMTRMGFMSESHVAEAEDIDDTGGTMVTFIIVFYVGYCYNRSNQQFDDVQLIMHSINDACLSARVSFGDPDEVHRLWRYLNLLHASAYCGLTDELSHANFFMPIVEKFKLMGSGKVKEEELEAIQRINLDENGSRACSMFEVWAFEVVKGEARRTTKGEGDLTPPIQARLQGEINNVGVCIKRLFAYRYQVMPFIYTHLVSLACFIYLAVTAFLAGIKWKPESSVTFGLTVPMILLITKIFSTFGLIEVGETILDPFGSDPEDFAILHFVEVTCCSSHEAIEIESCGERLKDRPAFYTHEELDAAKAIVRRVEERFLFRKFMAAARSAAKRKAAARQKRGERKKRFLTDLAASGSISVAQAQQLIESQPEADATPSSPPVPSGEAMVHQPNAGNEVKLADVYTAPATKKHHYLAGAGNGMDAVYVRKERRRKRTEAEIVERRRSTGLSRSTTAPVGVLAQATESTEATSPSSSAEAPRPGTASPPPNAEMKNLEA